jgi:hypothetical protein
MIANDQELSVTLDRIAKFQRQVAHLRNVETNPSNYHGSVSGYCFLGGLECRPDEAAWTRVVAEDLCT